MRGVDQFFRLVHAVFQQFGGGNIVAVRIFALAQRQIALGEKAAQFRQQGQLVLDRQFDIDALNAVGVFPHAIQRNHHVFVDLERVGVLGNRSGAGAVKPEFFACFGADRNKAFADAGVGDTDHFGCCLRHRVFIIADDIAEQGHLRQYATLGLGRITDGAQIALIQMFQTGQDGAALPGFRVEVILDFHDRWNRITRLTKEFQANRAHMLGHLVQNPARRGDQAIATFLLDTRQAGQELVGNILA